MQIPCRFQTGDYSHGGNLIILDYAHVEYDPDDRYCKDYIDIYDPKDAGRALSGDYVEWDSETEKCTLVRRTAHPALAGILAVCSKTIYGLTSRHVPIYLFHPFDKSYPPFRVGCSTKDRTRNKVAVVRFDDWPAADTFPRANLERILGDAGDLEAELAGLAVYANPYWRPAASPLCPASALVTAPSTQPLTAVRTVLGSDWWTINIDPAGCKDIDDTLSFKHNPASGAWEIIIGIADVAAAVPAGDALDKAAELNAETVYSPAGEALRPMLPPALSEDVCSLRAGQERPIVGLRFIWNGTQICPDPKFGLYTIRNNATFTYEAAATAAIPAGTPLACPGASMQPLADILTPLTAYMEREPVDASADPHKWVEACMKFYNMRAAFLLWSHDSGLLRVNDSNAYYERQRMTTHGYAPNYETVSPAYYTPAAPGRRDMSHWSISKSGPVLYCHATSPIRRYADLVNQRALKAIIVDERRPLPTESDDKADHLNRRQRAIRRAGKRATLLTLLIAGPAVVEGTVVECMHGKSRVWIKEWNKFVRYNGELPVGEPVRFRFFADMNKPSWSERIVIEKVDTA